MPLSSRRIRLGAYVVLAAAIGVLSLVRPAHAGWSADPVQVHATTALCPAVASAADGSGGAVIAWQENGATGGVIRMQHLLASGDLDPAWSGPVPVTDYSTPRTVLGAVSAGAGGVYIWWMEYSALYLQRITRIGTVAPGWPARGRLITWLLSPDYRPSLAPDGSAGIYIGILASPVNDPSYEVSIVVRHLNASGGPVDGSPVAGRIYPQGHGRWLWSISSFAMDPVPDGGLWLAWHRLGTSNSGAGDLSVLQLTSGVLPAAGWGADGDSLAPFYLTHPMTDSPLPNAPYGSEVGVAHDGSGGAFVLSRQPLLNTINLEMDIENSLRHVDGSGSPASGWTPDGVILSTGPEYVPGGTTAEAAVRALADEHGGVFTGLPFYPTEFSSTVNFSRRSAAGNALPGGVDVAQQGIEFAPRGDGGMFVASFKPSGSTGANDADANISVSQSSPDAGYFESKPSGATIRYGDIALTATGDGGAIFAWSQLIDRQGIYAIRLGQAGPVTGVPPTPVIGAPSLRARFVRGEGVHAVASFSAAQHVSLGLYDVAGRRVASLASDATLGADVVFPGTRDLPGGVYFARASDGTCELHASVVVLP